MILINVLFVEMDQSYDFKVDENTCIEQVIEEMVGMISQKEHFSLSKRPHLFLLCNKQTEKIYSLSTTLAENGVTSGDTLLLV